MPFHGQAHHLAPRARALARARIKPIQLHQSVSSGHSHGRGHGPGHGVELDQSPGSPPPCRSGGVEFATDLVISAWYAEKMSSGSADGQSGAERANALGWLWQRVEVLRGRTIAIRAVRVGIDDRVFADTIDRYAAVLSWAYRLRDA